MGCSLEGDEPHEMCRAVSTRQALTQRLGQEKWKNETTLACDALWARKKLSWTWGDATGARQAARGSVKIGIQGSQAARPEEKMSAGSEEQIVRKVGDSIAGKCGTARWSVENWKENVC
ncbi:hypothetical protein B0H14DRAFT_2573664 [Mycena olivaceomarginata]|nr:hypothetical protein B0H14DRAFT_2573664 [Mycena olivaceomarginata]